MTYSWRFWLLCWVWGVAVRELAVALRRFKPVDAGWGGMLLAAAFAIVFFQTLRSAPFLPLVIPGCLAVLGSWLLFEWAARTIRGYFFSYIFSKDEPRFVCVDGPFAYIRHPFYTSYLLLLGGAAMVFPNLVTVAVVAALVMYFQWAARFEEKKFEQSARAEEYAAYQRRTGRFFPKL